MLVFLLGITAARADLQITFTPAGVGQTNVTVTGFLFLDADSQAILNESDRLSIGGFTFLATNLASSGDSFVETSSLSLPGGLTSGTFADTPVFMDPAGFSGDQFSLTLSPHPANASLLVFPRQGSFTWDENLTLDFDHSDLNLGVWTWGTPGGLGGDGITLSIAIPEPAHLPLLLASLTLVVLTRRRHV